MANKKDIKRIKEGIIAIKRQDRHYKGCVTLKEDRSNFRTWHACLSLRLEDGNSAEHELNFSLVDVLEGNVEDNEDYSVYWEYNQPAYDLELKSCEKLVKGIIAQTIHEDHMEELYECGTVNEWLRHVKPPEDAATASYLLAEMTARKIDDFTGLEEYLTYMKTTYTRIRRCANSAASIKSVLYRRRTASAKHATGPNGRHKI